MLTYARVDYVEIITSSSRAENSVLLHKMLFVFEWIIFQRPNYLYDLDDDDC